MEEGKTKSRRSSKPSLSPLAALQGDEEKKTGQPEGIPMSPLAALLEDEEAKTGPLSNSRISARDAVLAASRYFQEVAGYSGPLTVEEVELSQDGRWAVTLGYMDQNAGPFAFQAKKQYKTFRVHDRTGVVESMKIREPQS